MGIFARDINVVPKTMVGFFGHTERVGDETARRPRGRDQLLQFYIFQLAVAVTVEVSLR